MTRKLILAAVLMLSFTMVSCNTKTDNTTSSSNNDTAVEQNKDANSSSKTESTDNSTANSTDNNTSTSKEDTKANTIKLSIYTIDENSLQPNETGTIQVNESLSLEDKLKALSKTVSEKNFDKLTIEVKSIDTVNGKKVATINLTDTGNKKWVSKFQGSTGGAVTANTLIENFLQSNNKSRGEWIDGVKFLYNNATIEYDHVADLSTIQYRS